jgi:hypothetical protein
MPVPCAISSPLELCNAQPGHYPARMFRRHAPSFWSRPLMLALLVLGLVVAPVLVAMGNTYEAAHGETAEQHDHAPEAHDDGADLLHAVAHCATCGAHTPGLPPMASLIAPIPNVHPEAALRDAAPPRAPETLLRPPISA